MKMTREPIQRPTQDKAGFRARAVGRLDRTINAGNIVLDVKNLCVWAEGEPVQLRAREFGLLAALAERPGELLSWEMLAAEVWGSSDIHTPRAIHVHVQRIRVALARRSSFNYVQTVRGYGYRFAPFATHPRLKASANGR